ncbi:MAG: AAA family ATPase [Natrialbaceae archaeon]|nr:AAA family ATPase [Natrialbaceae archaeon]
MRVEAIELEHFRCFGSTELALEPGVTVVHGVNGSGKTTLLDGIFFALYGADALDDQTLEDVITIGAEDAAVSLSFTHDGEPYSIEREIRIRGERATTTACTLTPPSGAPIEGVTDVQDRVESLLRMDAEAFVNCAYVRQGEVNTLIHASPAERQDMIDDLLQLGALERYRDRASDARLGVKTVLDGQQEVVASIREQIETIEADDPHGELNALESERAQIDTDLEEARTDREEVRDRIDEVESTLDAYEDARAKIESLESDVEELRSTIAEIEATREELGEQLRSCREDRSSLEDDLAEYRSAVDLAGMTVSDRLQELEETDSGLRDDLETHRTAITRAQDELDRIEDERSGLTERQEDLEAEHETLAAAIEDDSGSIAERREELADQERQREELASSFESAPVPASAVADHRETLTRQREGVGTALSEIDARLEAIEAAIEERESLAAAGQCPTCGQPVEDAPHLHDLDEQRAERDRLETRRTVLQDRRADHRAGTRAGPRAGGDRQYHRRVRGRDRSAHGRDRGTRGGPGRAPGAADRGNGRPRVNHRGTGLAGRAGGRARSHDRDRAGRPGDGQRQAKGPRDRTHHARVDRRVHRGHRGPRGRDGLDPRAPLESRRGQ